MKQNLRSLSFAASAFVIAGLFSFGWSARGLSLSIEKAEARVGRPLTPVSVAGVARRHYRRAAVRTGLAAGAGSYYAGEGYSGGPYHQSTINEAKAAYREGHALADSVTAGNFPHYAVRAYYADGPWYGYSGWDDYAARNSIKCTPGSLIKLDDQEMYFCQ